MLTVEGVEVSIGATQVLRGVSLIVGAGEAAGLIGRNGAGKTTLLRTVMGLLVWQRGRIDFEGRSLKREPTHARTRLGIGYMPEDRRLVPDLTARENVLLPAWAIGLKDAADRLDRILRVMPELEGISDRKAVLLSGGEQKMVALARALMTGTKMLLLDEPFEGVAPALAKRLAQVIAERKRDGLAAVLAQSEPSHSKGLLDSVFAIDRGEIGRAER
jgi:branched-chain amino acid transport system ATP-binding protein